MKKGKDLMQFIKTTAKISSEKLSDFQHEANDLIYKNNLSFISPATASTLYDKFVSLGQELKDLQVTDKQNPKKQEILAGLRDNCRNLKIYKSAKLSVSDVPDCQAQMKYQLYKYLEAKRNNTITLSLAFEFLKANKDIYDNMVLPLLAIAPDSISTREVKNFTDINHELLTIIYNRYELQPNETAVN